MVVAGHSASLALLVSFAFGVADSIRTLKDGPMIDAEGREYKGAAPSVRGPRLDEGPTVRVQCTEASMIIVVKADLYKNGRPVSPGELFLGDAEHWQSRQCRVAAAAAGDAEYVLEAALQDCGSKLTVSGDSVIYSNDLVVSPAASYHGITRTAHAVVPVSCHYKRTHFVSSSSQRPSLIFPASAKRPAAHSAFSLKLMADDWTRETFSSVFYVGDPLLIEASYTGPDSGQRRVFMDSCVATLSPDAASVPRYYFVESHGCLTEEKEGGSSTLFQPRPRANSLQLQLEAFLFHQDSRNSIFITCQLKATSKMKKSSPIDKACNYERARWRNVDGSDDVCRCCDSTCYTTSPRWNNKTNQSRRLSEDITVYGTVTLGPLTIFPTK